MNPLVLPALALLTIAAGRKAPNKLALAAVGILAPWPLSLVFTGLSVYTSYRDLHKAVTLISQRAAGGNT